MPSTSSTTCRPPRSGVGSPGTVPTERRPTSLGRDAAHDREPDVAHAVAVARNVRPGIEAGPTEAELEHLGAHRLAELAAPPTCRRRGSTTPGPRSRRRRSRAGPRRGRRARTRRCARACRPAWQLKLVIFSSGMGSTSGGARVRVTRPGGALGAGPRRSGASSITTVPPWCSVIALTIARPRPRPPASRARPSSRRVNRSNTRSRSSGRMPGPSSSTVSSTMSCVGHAARRRPSSSRGARRCRAGCGPLAAAGRVDRARGRPTRDRCRRGRVAAARCRRAPARRGRPRATSSIGAGPSASSRRARSSSSLTVSSMRTSSASARCATSGQSARSGLCSATSRLVRIDASGLRSSCDASDTNCRCFCADVSSRREHRVHRAGETADLVVGGGLGNPPVHGRCR